MKIPPEDICSAICALLEANRAAYRKVEHVPTFTSEESAVARGEPLRNGGKALLMKADERFVLVVIPADRKLDSKLARSALSCRKLRFATISELLDETGLVPGSVPPFGPPIFSFPVHIDLSLLDNDRIAFNAGSLVTSVIVTMEDYISTAKPAVGEFVVR
jgi:Ala-tRNA(Pro) deacylase